MAAKTLKSFGLIQSDLNTTLLLNHISEPFSVKQTDDGVTFMTSEETCIA